MLLAALSTLLIGLVTGSLCSLVGWISVGILLVLATLVSGVAIGYEASSVLGSVLAAIATFNAGLALSLIIPRVKDRSAPQPTSALKTAPPGDPSPTHPPPEGTQERPA